MTDETYKVRVEGAGLTLERDVPKDVGEKVVVLILTGAASGQRRAEVIPPAGGGTDPNPASSTSIREFLDASQAGRSPDKIAAFGVYFSEHQKKQSFSADDIQSAFEDAAEAVPANLSRDIKWAVKAGWIANRSGQPGTYYITNTGRDAVNKKFPKDMLKKTAIKFGGKKKNGKSEGS